MGSKVKGLKQAIQLTLHKHRVLKTLDSGVLPLVLRYDQINACDTRLPIAYRTKTLVRSTALGYLTPDEYMASCANTEVGFRLAEWSVTEAMKHITRFVESGRGLQWISVRCPSEMVERVDLYLWMKQLIKKNRFQYSDRLCLEFDVSLLRRKTEAARIAILDMKLLGVKTLLVGCGGADCPTSRIVQIPVDMVMLDPSVTRWTSSRNKPQLVVSMIPYLKSMRAEVYAEGVQNDEQILQLSRCECVGYSVDSSYSGKDPTECGMGVRRALSQKDTEDGFRI